MKTSIALDCIIISCTCYPDVKFMGTPFVCASCEDEIFDDVQMIVCLSSATPCIMSNRIDCALQQGMSA